MERVVEPLTEGRDYISCWALYRAMGGYDHDGGRYDSAQRVLRRERWAYLIQSDSWLSPNRQRGT